MYSYHTGDGTPHPAIGFGTYKVGVIPASASSAVAGTDSTADQRTAEECVRNALEVGYRFLECAEFYANESEVGKGIKASGIKRDELFLCSKVWTTTIEKGEEAIRAQLDKSELLLSVACFSFFNPSRHIECNIPSHFSPQ